MIHLKYECKVNFVNSNEFAASMVRVEDIFYTADRESRCFQNGAACLPKVHGVTSKKTVIWMHILSPARVSGVWVGHPYPRARPSLRRALPTN
jgi:hypothetical protein